MQVSDQIIAVLDDLCKRFGVVIDWSQENIIPYAQELASKYIKYEIGTSIAWCVLIGAVLIIAVAIAKIAFKNSIEELAVTMTIFAVFIAIIYIFIIGQQIFDIIECCTIPEKTIIEAISILLKQ